jgi:2-amino-4-hydroxy-6-hydroxymethyldihydropteridine diphosphokinase
LIIDSPVTAYIGLGSNLQHPAKQLRQGFQQLQELPHSTLLHQSSLYQSAPLGLAEQPDYINAVAEIQTRLSASDLLQNLLDIESRQGRKRGAERWVARTLDLDLLLYSNEKIASENLVVPHPGLHQRHFVLYPLYEISPNLEIPGLGLIKHLVASCPRGDLVLLHDHSED